MMANRYRVVLNGDLVDGRDYNATVDALSVMFRTSPQRARKLFQEIAFPLDGELDRVKAEELKAAIESAGACCVIEPILQPEIASNDEMRPLVDADIDDLISEGKQETVLGPERLGGVHVRGDEPQRYWMIPSLVVLLLVGVLISVFITGPASSESTAASLGVDNREEQNLWAGRYRKTIPTERKLIDLDGMVVLWMKKQGEQSNPKQVTLRQVREDLHLSSAEMLDGWGKPFLYEPTLTGYVLRSEGPDRAINTEDDLVVVHNLW